MEKSIQIRAIIPESDISSVLNLTLLDGDFRGLDYDVETGRFKPFYYPVRAQTRLVSTLGYTFTQISNSLICVGGETNFTGQVNVIIDNKESVNNKWTISDINKWRESEGQYYFDTEIEMLSPEIDNEVEKKCQGSVTLIMSENLD